MADDISTQLLLLSETISLNFYEMKRLQVEAGDNPQQETFDKFQEAWDNAFIGWWQLYNLLESDVLPKSESVSSPVVLQ